MNAEYMRVTPVNGDPYTLKFTGIFEDTSQNTLYEECVCSIVTKLIEQYKNKDSVLLSYGRTSSGKTYTIQGSREDPGIIPNAIRDFFDGIDGKLHKKPEYRPIRAREREKVYDTRYETTRRDQIVKWADDNIKIPDN
jgi:hypothetical protein